jgi:hypothetical protein
MVEEGQPLSLSFMENESPAGPPKKTTNFDDETKNFRRNMRRLKVKQVRSE